MTVRNNLGQQNSMKGLLFTKPKLQRKVETYLYDIFNRYNDDKKFFFDLLDT